MSTKFKKMFFSACLFPTTRKQAHPLGIPGGWFPHIEQCLHFLVAASPCCWTTCSPSWFARSIQGFTFLAWLLGKKIGSLKRGPCHVGWVSKHAADSLTFLGVAPNQRNGGLLTMTSYGLQGVPYLALHSNRAEQLHDSPHAVCAACSMVAGIR